MAATIKALAKRAIHSSRPVCRAYYSNRFARAQDLHQPIILIHQMGKVGSSTLVRSLEKAPPAAAVYRTHHLSAELRARIGSAFVRRDAVNGFAKRPDDHVIMADYILGRLRRRRADERWRIVTLVRDPVARNVAAFFQSFHIYFPESDRSLLNGKPEDLPVLQRMFLEQFELENRMPLHWFDTEMRSIFGIDVFATPFPHARGYQTYSGPFADLLLLRLESLSAGGTEAIRDFLGLPEFELVSANVGKQKAYGPGYVSFKQRAALPKRYLDQMYGSPLARHFYTDVELAAFRARWTADHGVAEPH